MSILYLSLALLFLFLSQGRITKELSRIIHRLGGDQNIVIWIWSIFFLPGTVIHEISHFLVAIMTGARTGNIEIFPEFIEEILEDEEESKSVRLGSVQVQRLNPIQGFLVGLAPFISGMALLIWIASLLQNSFQFRDFPMLALQLYFFFVIANSFFPSWTDIKQVLPLVVLVLIFSFIIWIAGFNISLPAGSPVWNLMDTMTNALVISIGLNLVIIFILILTNKVLRHR